MHPLFRPSTKRFAHRGSMSVEMIGVLVALLVLTIGIVQFGIFLGNAQIVAFAAKVAGEEASQTPALPAMGAVPTNIVEAMQRHLESSNIKYCAIRLEHNDTLLGDPVELETQQNPLMPCDCGPAAVLAPGDRPGDRYVRVTVCVPLSQVMPAGVSFFGTQLYGASDTYEHTAVYRYELP